MKMALTPDRRNHIHVISFDPGGITGWAHFVIHRKAFTNRKRPWLPYIMAFATGQYRGAEAEQVLKANDMVRRARYGPNGNYAAEFRLLSESFQLRQTRGGDELLSPVRINALLEFTFMQHFQLELEYQESAMRTGVTPERLRRWGFWWKGKDSLAAVQHGVTKIKRLKAESKRRPWSLR